MDTNKRLVVRTRGIIYHEGKLLVVKHGQQVGFYALPGGHIEWAETPEECFKREIKEELGIEPVVGRLLYIHTFVEKEKEHSVEFFFEVTNASDYLDLDKLKGGTHAYEIFDMKWVGKDENFTILPSEIQKDLNEGNLLSDQVRFIDDKK